MCRYVLKPIYSALKYLQHPHGTRRRAVLSTDATWQRVKTVTFKKFPSFHFDSSSVDDFQMRVKVCLDWQIISASKKMTFKCRRRSNITKATGNVTSNGKVKEKSISCSWKNKTGEVKNLWEKHEKFSAERISLRFACVPISVRCALRMAQLAAFIPSCTCVVYV